MAVSVRREVLQPKVVKCEENPAVTSLCWCFPKTILVCKLILVTRILAEVKKLGMGVLEQLMKIVWMEWRLRREEESLVSLFERFPRFPLFNFLIMNVIMWNCRGALKPNFQRHVNKLVRIHNSAILVVMETRVGGDKAKEIINRLPFDGAILVETIR